MGFVYAVKTHLGVELLSQSIEKSLASKNQGFA